MKIGADMSRIQHQEIKAADLRDGDLLRLGASTNYVLVASAQPIESRIAVTIYNGTTAQEKATLHFDSDDKVSLSMRNAKP